MNLLSIIMDSDRNLSAKSFSLGVERDHKIDKLVLVTDEFYGGASLSEASVSLHLKAESGYTYNQLCDEKVIENGVVYFIFPVTREMTCVSGSVRVEFFFDNPSVPFSFTTRSTELIVAKPLTDTSEVESDYPGILSDVLTEVSGFSNRLSTADTLIETLNNEIGVLLEKQNENTLSIKNIEAFFGYNDEEILGLEADFENSSFTRLAGARGLCAGEDFNDFLMYQRRRCNVADDGTILAYYGDENYRDDGSNGQVMVYQPKFYYRVVPTKLEKIEGGVGYHIKKANYYISAKPKPFFKLHPAFYDENGKAVEYILYGAYEGSVSSNKLCSVAGVKPTDNNTRFQCENLAKARGAGWHIETLQAISVNQLLFAIEYASFNAQEAVGSGITALKDDGASNCASFTGSTAHLGNNTGLAEKTVNEIGGVETIYSENGKVAVSYRGVENLWGNLYTHISNVNPWGDGTMLGGQLYVCEDFNININKHDGNYSPVGFLIPNDAGGQYISYFGFGNEPFDWVFTPSAVGSTSLLPVGDYILSPNDIKMHYGVVYGGRYDTSRGSGLFMLRFCGGDVPLRDVTARLIFIPSAK